jgi:hypothetical protein
LIAATQICHDFWCTRLSFKTLQLILGFHFPFKEVVSGLQCELLLCLDEEGH